MLRLTSGGGALSGRQLLAPSVPHLNVEVVLACEHGRSVVVANVQAEEVCGEPREGVINVLGLKLSADRKALRSCYTLTHGG